MSYGADTLISVLFCLLFTKPSEVDTVISALQMRNWNSEKFGNLPKFTKLVISKAGFQIQYWLQDLSSSSPCSNKMTAMFIYSFIQQACAMNSSKCSSRSYYSIQEHRQQVNNLTRWFQLMVSAVKNTKQGNNNVGRRQEN